MSKILLKTAEEIALIRESATILSQAHGQVAKYIQPGIATSKLDEVAETFIRDQGAIPSFKGYKGFPATLCISVNEQVIHGLPGPYRLQEGDIISVDCGACYKGYHSDAAFTYAVGNVRKELLHLLSVVEDVLSIGIEKATTKNRVGDIGYAIQHYVEKHGYSVVREYGGHGVGVSLHEEPYVPNFGRQGSGIRIKEGMVFAIEPMVNLGKAGIVQGNEAYVVSTKDRKPSAHFEHTVAVIDGKAEALTTYDYIKSVLQKEDA